MTPGPPEGGNYGCFISPDPDDPFVDTPDLCGVKDNVVVNNTATHNGVTGIYVGPRSTPGCGTNTWIQSLFNTVNQPCVRG